MLKKEYVNFECVLCKSDLTTSDDFHFFKCEACGAKIKMPKYYKILLHLGTLEIVKKEELDITQDFNNTKEMNKLSEATNCCNKSITIYKNL